MAGVKAQVAREVCAASAAFASCTHHRRRRATAPFVDWYLVLAVSTRPCLVSSPSRARRGLLPLTERVLCNVSCFWPRSGRPRRRRPSGAATGTSVRTCSTRGHAVCVPLKRCVIFTLSIIYAALQLHPDKNRHPKAELAFNLVSEVYNQRTTATAAVLARMRIGTFDSTISTLLFMMISGAGVHSESLPFWLSLTPFCCS